MGILKHETFWKRCLVDCIAISYLSTWVFTHYDNVIHHTTTLATVTAVAQH